MIIVGLTFALPFVVAAAVKAFSPLLVCVVVIAHAVRSLP
jgi:hypothetical protein